ncbi:MAG: 50S ribosomal protein L24 [Planctomycetota bacterium]|jgi:large subunit ribosomal protein L24|nr:50S ribosomal protein L24 [Planctomycetota bacterium]
METVKTRIRKNDIVQVMAGSDGGKVAPADVGERGMRGKVLEIDRAGNRAKVQGVRMIYRHLPRSKDPAKPGGGRIEKEAFVSLSGLMLVCPKCDEATRAGVRLEKQEREGGIVKTRRVRVCKKCGADILERD